MLMLQILMRAASEKIKWGDEEGGQKRLQADLVAVEINFPETRPLSVEFPEQLNIPPVATQQSIEDYFANYLMNAYVTINEEYTYGSRILEFPHFIPDEHSYSKTRFNQLDWIVTHFKKAPSNNHCVIEVAKGDDVLLEHAPCLRLLSFKIVNGRLNVTVFFRSWDFWSGFPTNLGGIQLLNEYIASEIGIETGKIFAVSDGLYIYTHNIRYALRRLGRE